MTDRRRPGLVLSYVDVVNQYLYSPPLLLLRPLFAHSHVVLQKLVAAVVVVKVAREEAESERDRNQTI